MTSCSSSTTSRRPSVLHQRPALAEHLLATRRTSQPDLGLSRYQVLHGRHADQGADRRAGDLPGHHDQQGRALRASGQLAWWDGREGLQGARHRHQGQEPRSHERPRPVLRFDNLQPQHQPLPSEGRLVSFSYE